MSTQTDEREINGIVHGDKNAVEVTTSNVKMTRQEFRHRWLIFAKRDS